MCWYPSRVTFTAQLLILVLLNILSLPLCVSFGSIGEHAENVPCNKASLNFPCADQRMETLVLNSPNHESTSTGLAAQKNRNQSLAWKEKSSEGSAFPHPDRWLAIDHPGPSASIMSRQETIGEEDSGELKEDLASPMDLSAAFDKTEDPQASSLTQILSPEDIEAEKVRLVRLKDLAAKLEETKSFRQAMANNFLDILNCFHDIFYESNRRRSRVPWFINKKDAEKIKEVLQSIKTLGRHKLTPILSPGAKYICIDELDYDSTKQIVSNLGVKTVEFIKFLLLKSPSENIRKKGFHSREEQDMVREWEEGLLRILNFIVGNELLELNEIKRLLKGHRLYIVVREHFKNLANYQMRTDAKDMGRIPDYLVFLVKKLKWGGIHRF